MPKPLELRKIIKILKPYKIEFYSNIGGKHSGKFIRANNSK